MSAKQQINTHSSVEVTQDRFWEIVDEWDQFLGVADQAEETGLIKRPGGPVPPLLLYSGLYRGSLSVEGVMWSVEVNTREFGHMLGKGSSDQTTIPYMVVPVS